MSPAGDHLVDPDPRPVFWATRRLARVSWCPVAPDSWEVRSCLGFEAGRPGGPLLPSSPALLPGRPAWRCLALGPALQDLIQSPAAWALFGVRTSPQWPAATAFCSALQGQGACGVFLLHLGLCLQLSALPMARPLPPTSGRPSPSDWIGDGQVQKASTHSCFNFITN